MNVPVLIVRDFGSAGGRVPGVKTGCGCGCLTIVLIALLALGAVWLARGIFDRPEASYEIGSPADGRRAQQKVFELAGGFVGHRRDPRRASVTLTERELNALLTRHLSQDMPLADGGIRLVGDGIIEVTGRLPLHALLGDTLGSVGRLLPERWAGQPVWVRLRGHVRLETGASRADVRRLRLEPESFRVGSRRIPVAVLAMLPDGPVPRATRRSVPETIEAVVIEPGRLTIVTRP